MLTPTHIPPGAPTTPPLTFADIYDRVVGPDYWERWWPVFDRLVDTHQLTFATVCDVACGTGETVRRLSRRGVTVSGTDLCPDMIRVATTKCARWRPLLQVQPMQALQLPQPVELIICAFDSLNMLADADQLVTTLHRFASQLIPGGHLICDLVTRTHLAETWGSGEISAQIDDIQTIWHTHWQPDTLTIHLSAFIPTGEGHTERVVQQVTETAFPQTVIETAMTDAGFELLEARDMDSWGAGSEQSERLFYLLRKV